MNPEKQPESTPPIEFTQNDYIELLRKVDNLSDGMTVHRLKGVMQRILFRMKSIERNEEGKFLLKKEDDVEELKKELSNLVLEVKAEIRFAEEVKYKLNNPDQQ